jgi:hypothetical protein
LGVLGVPLLLPAGTVVGVEALLEPAVVAPADAEVLRDVEVPGDVEASGVAWTAPWKEQPPTLSTVRRTAAVRTDARVIPER